MSASEQDSQFVDPKLGVMTVTHRERAFTRKWLRGISSPPTWCRWGGRVRVAGRVAETHVALSGNEEGPHRSLLEATHAVLDGLEAIAEKVNRALERRRMSCRFCDFYVHAIDDWDEHDDVLKVELHRLSATDLTEDVELYWPGDDWALDHHIVLRCR